MPRGNVQNDKYPILNPAHESEYPKDYRRYGTGNVYPAVPRPKTDSSDNDIAVEKPPPPHGPRGRLSKRAFNAVIVLVTIFTNVMMNVSLPIFAGTMDVIGGDTFVVLSTGAVFFPFIFFLMTMVIKRSVKLASFRAGVSWKILFVMGFATTLNGILVVFASPPDRTPPYLQGILATTVIPFTVISRIIILRKGISLRRFACTVTVLIGLFITIEPQIWGLEGSGGSNSSGSTNIYWPLIFTLGFLPVGITTVLCEKELKQDQADSFTFIMWTQVFQLMTTLPLFWVDFIPHFGMATDFHDFIERLHTGLGCCFSLDPVCNGLSGKLWLFLIGYTLANLSQFLLIEYTEGAVYAVVVQSMVTPLATIFWTLFKFDVTKPEGVPTTSFYWSPQFNVTTMFTLGGLVIIVPAVIMYNYFSKQDAKAKTIEESNVRDVIDERKIM